jgi:hypothetical protein|tara:strand:- start:360 stop:581 length:222 start_codon:yes stop_codon:yes gene_type:complete
MKKLRGRFSKMKIEQNQKQDLKLEVKATGRGRPPWGDGDPDEWLKSALRLTKRLKIRSIVQKIIGRWRVEPWD